MYWSGFNCAGVAILAGGHSRRMGTPKALLEVNGTSLLQTHVAAANALNLPALVCSNQHDYAPLISQPFIRVADSSPHQGPLAALAGALHSIRDTRSQWLAVISVDTMIDVQQLLILLNAHINCIPSSFNRKDAVYLYDSATKKEYPLLGMYRIDILHHLNQYLAADNRRVMPFVNSLNCSKISAPIGWNKLLNINTPSDYHQALNTFDNTHNRLKPFMNSAQF